MKVLYCRVSTADQKTDRQKATESDYNLVIEDKCSGAVPFFEREGGKEIKKLTEKGVLKSLAIYSIDRAGRDLRDILKTIHFFSQRGIVINFISQGLTTLTPDGKENSISKLMISILGTVSEMERKQIRERQLDGIRIAKLKGDVYKGRKAGSREDALAFLSKKKNKEALELLKKGVSCKQAANAVGINKNTIAKIRKLGLVA